MPPTDTTLYYVQHNNPDWPLVVGMAILALAATILDYIVPAVGARRFKCSGLGVFGCVVGSIIGVFFFPIGMFLGPFLGAFIGELLVGRSISGAMKGGTGAVIGFLSGVLIKFSVCFAMGVTMIWCVVKA